MPLQACCPGRSRSRPCSVPEGAIVPPTARACPTWASRSRRSARQRASIAPCDSKSRELKGPSSRWPSSRRLATGLSLELTKAISSTCPRDDGFGSSAQVACTCCACWCRTRALQPLAVLTARPEWTLRRGARRVSAGPAAEDPGRPWRHPFGAAARGDQVPGGPGKSVNYPLRRRAGAAAGASGGWWRRCLRRPAGCCSCGGASC